MIEKVLERYVPALSLYARLEKSGTAFLDSSMQGALGRRSYICMVPYRTYGPDEGDAASVIDSRPEGGVMAGYVSYDHGLEMHGICSRHPPSDIPSFLLTDYDILVTDDPESRELTVLCIGRALPDTEELAMVETAVSAAKEPDMPDGEAWTAVDDTSREDFEKAVQKAREMMRDGEFYVINLTRTVRVSSEMDPFDAFLRLRSLSPSPFGAYLDCGRLQILSSSMELLLEARGRDVHTRPIKGTCPRTGTAERDRLLLEGLLSSEKDRSELLMVTDMERNDMNRFCEPGSVKVESFFEPEIYATVCHTVSDIVGRASEGVGYGRMLECMFPGGSITGAPKESCMEAIDSLEKCRRGLYTGSIGIFTDDMAEINIAIRTMIHTEGEYSMGVGGGITFESDPAKEYDETVDKSRAMLSSLGETHGA